MTAALALTFTVGACGDDNAESVAPVTVTVPITPSPSTPTDPFVAWAQTAVVGDLLPSMAIEEPDALVAYAKGKCDAIKGEFEMRFMTSILKAHSNGSTSQAREMLVHMVETYCPEKSKWLD